MSNDINLNILSTVHIVYFGVLTTVIEQSRLTVYMIIPAWVLSRAIVLVCRLTYRAKHGYSDFEDLTKKPKELVSLNPWHYRRSGFIVDCEAMC